MLSSLLVLSLAAVVPLAQATVFITDPVATSTLAAGQQSTVTWQDDGTAPSLATFGLASIGLYVGTQSQQTLLQSIATNIDVSKVNSQTWAPSATVGPNFAGYFIRIQSNSAPNPNNTQFPAQAFSAKFTLTGMTGTFNSTVQAEISGAVSSAGASSTPAAASASGSVGSIARVSTAGTPVSTVKGSSAASAAASAKSSSNGAGHITVPHILTVAGIVAITFAFFL